MSAPAHRSGTLYLLATPIGNLEDVTLRALRVLSEVSFVACEDTRTTHKLLARHGIEARLVSCHEHNENRRAAEIAEALARGDDVALVTDAGTPVVSDPGGRVVAAVVAAGHVVVAVPGPSAVLTALAASGLAADRFTFLGFLPARGRERGSALAATLALPGAVILFEAPHRIRRTIADLAARAPERRASVHREMTKLYEETLRGTLAELAERVAAAPARGEYTVVIAGAPAAERALASVPEAVELGRRLVGEGSTPSDAAREAAARTGVARRVVYRAIAGRSANDSEE